MARWQRGLVEEGTRLEEGKVASQKLGLDAALGTEDTQPVGRLPAAEKDEEACLWGGRVLRE